VSARDRLAASAAFGRFWWNFVVGDDWHVAAALGLMSLLRHEGIDARSRRALVVGSLLTDSQRRATRPGA
jgi:hypothetical protein